MRVICEPSRLQGTIKAVPSKSAAHRLLICSALANKPTHISMRGPLCEDIEAARSCLLKLGAACKQDETGITVVPMEKNKNGYVTPFLDCRESGATLRFLLPVVAALGCGGYFTGKGRLDQRPIAPLLDALKQNGVQVFGDTLPLRIEGKLQSGSYMLPGNISSQFVSGLLFALPLLAHGGEVILAQPLESASYVEMTLDALSRFGIVVERREQGYRVQGGQYYHSPGKVQVEGDWSNAAFFLAGGALCSGAGVRVNGIFQNSLQGDRALCDLLKDYGATVAQEKETTHVRAGHLRGKQQIDVRNSPDLLPILAVVAACTPGETVFEHTARLRLKESDRVSSTLCMLRALGGTARVEGNALYVMGQPWLEGGRVESCQDHRIAMAAAIAAVRCKRAVVIAQAEAVNKSYPGFFREYQRLGGKAYVEHDG